MALFSVPDHSYSLCSHGVNTPLVDDDVVRIDVNDKRPNELLEELVALLDECNKEEESCSENSSDKEKTDASMEFADPLLANFSVTVQDDDSMQLPAAVEATDAAAAQPATGQSYLNVTPTWSNFDLDNIVNNLITVEDLNLPEIVPHADDAVHSPPDSTVMECKDITAMKPNSEEATMEEEPAAESREAANDDSDSDYSPDNERKSVRIAARRKAGRPRGSGKVKSGRVNKKTRIVQCRLEVNLEKGQRLYDAAPFTDPAQERCRKNAINAKLNRERKRKEKEALGKQINLLRRENQKLQEESAAAEERASRAEAELQRMRLLLASNGLACSSPTGHQTLKDKMSCGVCGQGNV